MSRPGVPIALDPPRLRLPSERPNGPRHLKPGSERSVGPGSGDRMFFDLPSPRMTSAPAVSAEAADADNAGEGPGVRGIFLSQSRSRPCPDRRSPRDPPPSFYQWSRFAPTERHPRARDRSRKKNRYFH